MINHPKNKKKNTEDEEIKKKNEFLNEERKVAMSHVDECTKRNTTQ